MIPVSKQEGIEWLGNQIKLEKDEEAVASKKNEKLKSKIRKEKKSK